jgi:hypothetical protein
VICIRTLRAAQHFTESVIRSKYLFLAIPDGKPVPTFPGIALAFSAVFKRRIPMESELLILSIISPEKSAAVRARG